MVAKAKSETKGTAIGWYIEVYIASVTMSDKAFRIVISFSRISRAVVPMKKTGKCINTSSRCPRGNCSEGNKGDVKKAGADKRIITVTG